MLYKLVLTSFVSLCVKPWCVTIYMKASEQYFLVVLFVSKFYKKVIHTIIVTKLKGYC